MSNMKGNPTYLGTVQDVKGATISIYLDPDTIQGFSFINGHGYRIGQIGNFVRISIGYVDLFCVISQVGAGAVPINKVDNELHSYRWMTVQIIGERTHKGNFIRGVSQYPTIGDPVHLVTEQDLQKIYGQPDNGNYIKVGHLSGSEKISALIDINKLITRHCAVVGSTGSGKSTTVAGLLDSLGDKRVYESARILIIDIHGEYSKALSDIATTFRINPNEDRGEKPLFIPYWAMNFDELVPLTFGILEDPGRGGVLDKILEMKQDFLKVSEYMGVEEKNITVDTPIPFSIHKLWYDLHCLVNATHTVQPTSQSSNTQAFLLDNKGLPVEKGDPLKVLPPKYRPITQMAGAEKIYLSGSPLNIRRQVTTLASRLRDSRYDFLFRPGPWCPDIDGRIKQDLDSLLKEWIGSENPISILDLSGIPNSILNNLIGALLRIIYDALFWAKNLPQGGRLRPLLLVLEEAHNYLNSDSNNSATSAVKKIAKEGRKYGIGLMLISQRPSEIDSTILSQCGTIFALRLANSSDRERVRTTVTENLEGLFSMLPILRTGETIIVGEAVPIPVRIIIDPPTNNRKPDSCDPIIYSPEEPGGWNKKSEDDDYHDFMMAWRLQNPKIVKSTPNILRTELKIKGDEKMNREFVSSSNLESVGYDLPTMTLEIEFHSGHIYQYFDVPEANYIELMNSSSKGEYFSQNIKGFFRYIRL